MTQTPTVESGKSKNESIFEKELRSMIVECIHKEYPKILERDLKEIIDKLLPDLDKLIAFKVKQHLVALCKAGIKRFETQGRKPNAKDSGL